MTKVFFFLSLLALGVIQAQAQRKINDVHVRNQQQRMVYQKWSDFTPEWKWWKPKTWPIYLMTWAWHPNYKKGDKRPLSGSGPYTQRLALLTTMHHTNKQILDHSKKLKNDALWEMANYSSTLTKADPLWTIYYKEEFEPLMEMSNILYTVKPKEVAYLNDTGILKWYLDECDIIRDRLQGLQKENMDRGNRMLAYNRLLGEFKKLQEKWNYHVARAEIFLQMKDAQHKLSNVSNLTIEWKKPKTDAQIAQEIFSKATFNLK